MVNRYGNALDDTLTTLGTEIVVPFAPDLPMIELPASPEAFRDAAWDDVVAYYNALAVAPLTLDDASVEPWLATWSRLDTLIGEAGTLAMIAYTANTTDASAEQHYLRFSTEIFPRLEEQQVRLARRLLDLGWSRDDLEIMLHRFRSDIEIFREANVERFAQIEELSAGYQKITGGLSVDWDGEAKTIPQLQPLLKDNDRTVRERAFRLSASAYLDKRVELADLFDRMYGLRVGVAREAGFADFQQYCFVAKHRFDYGPQDTARFHDAVKQTVAPAVERLMKHRQGALGVASLRPWDVSVDLGAKEPLRPFRDIDTFVGQATQVFHRVDPELGGSFD